MTYAATIHAFDSAENWHMEVEYGGFEEHPDTQDLHQRVSAAFLSVFGVPAADIHIEVNEERLSDLNEETEDGE